MSILKETERATIKAACDSLEKVRTVNGAIMIVNQIIKCLDCYSRGGCYKRKLKKHAVSVRNELRQSNKTWVESEIIKILISACKIYLEEKA